MGLMVYFVLMILACGLVSSTAAFPSDLQPPNNTLFAVLNSNCGLTLAYGPSPIDLSGEVGGTNRAYLSTNTTGKDVPHKEWLQIVTTADNEELFRVYWTFDTTRTLRDHFIAAAFNFQTVQYRVLDSDGAVYEYEGKWGLQGGHIVENFEATETQYGFTTGDVVWGAFEGSLDFDKQGYSLVPIALSGVYSYDRTRCSTVFRQGRPVSSGKSYLYYTDHHNSIPTPVIVDLSHNVTMVVTQRIAGMSYEDYSASPDAWDVSIKRSVVYTVQVQYEDITNLQVFAMPVHRTPYAKYETFGFTYTIVVPLDRNINYEDMWEKARENQYLLSDQLSYYAKNQGIVVPNYGYIFTIDIYTGPARPITPPHKSNKLATSVIVGVSIASCAGLLFLCYCVPPLCKKVCFKCVLPHLERMEERDLELQSVPPHRSPFTATPWRQLRSVRPVPTMAVAVTQVPRSDYLEVTVAEVQVVGPAEESE